MPYAGQKRKDAMSKNSVERSDASLASGAAGQVATDLHEGIEHRDLSKSISEIDNARSSMSAKEYNQFLTDVNKKVDEGKVLPRLAVDIVGVDESGKNLVLVDYAAGNGAIVDPHGKTIETLNEQQLLKMLGRGKHLLDAKQAAPNGDQYSVFSPPGLDKSGKGKLAIADSKRSSVTNGDTTTVSSSGTLNDSDWGINLHGYRSVGRTRFESSLTTTRDGKLLESHTDYRHGKYVDESILGGYLKDFPDVDLSIDLKIKEMNGFEVGPEEIDVKYNELADAYYGTIDKIGFRIKDGKTENIKTGGDFDDIGDLQILSGARQRKTDDRRAVLKDVDGHITGFKLADRKVSVQREKDHSIKGITDAQNGVWSKLDENRWQYERDGKTTIKTGDLFVDHDMNIVLQHDKGAEITSIHGTRYDVNELGLVTVSEQADGSKVEYSYNDEQELIKKVDAEVKKPFEWSKEKSRKLIKETEYEGAAPVVFPLKLI
jgi:hypothetical protein